MARFDLRDELHHQVEKTTAQGARLLLGGGKDGWGQVTTIRQRFWRMLPPEMTAFREEMFGPVAAITVAKDAEHALELANDSEFGLSATIFYHRRNTGQTDGGTSGMRWGVYQWLLCQRRASGLWWREKEWLWS